MPPLRFFTQSLEPWASCSVRCSVREPEGMSTPIMGAGGAGGGAWASRALPTRNRGIQWRRADMAALKGSRAGLVVLFTVSGRRRLVKIPWKDPPGPAMSAYILSATRTAVGSFGGALKPLNAVQLGALAIAEALTR